MAGMKTIIGLASLLAAGILLTILSCALDSNWLPILVPFIYLIAPLPNMLCQRIGSGGGRGDIWSDASEHRGVLETGYFITSFINVSGAGLPYVLAHANVITQQAMVLSIAGGLLVYGTILGYIHFFITEEPYM
ncbi:vacuolar protein sorting 55 [Fimicolochytrium jonesii]|uniref:vacuolar protein sorting 55 n=1 Tax=Fimicolochytrium jonesii TaxID=1396493 RepID=UPI0022FDE164|nr:vacuolar protein sorting 55 [Fimicolochytrium jonesii]KAI8826987.1 vacuolar protein sorting 55 [Fimicolochytrium jonesii]